MHIARSLLRAGRMERLFSQRISQLLLNLIARRMPLIFIWISFFQQQIQMEQQQTGSIVIPESVKKYFFPLVIILMVACNNTDQKNTGKFQNIDSTKQGKIVLYDTSYPFVNLIPDSLRTPKQKDFLNHLLKVIAKYVKVENNHMIFTLKEDQLDSFNIPRPYYQLIKQNMKENNEYFDKNGIGGVDTLWQNAIKRINQL